MRVHKEHRQRGARTWVLAAGLLVALGMSTGTASRASAVDDRVTLRSQLGIIYAQNGQVDDARKEFVKLLEEPNGRAAALTKACGKDRAAYLLGVKTDDGDTSKGKVTKLSSEEIKALLSKASARVPAANAAATGKDASRTPVVSRPGGARAADVSATPATLYWKEK